MKTNFSRVFPASPLVMSATLLVSFLAATSFGQDTVESLTPLAKKNDVKAQVNLGLLLAKRGDFKEALDWFKRASKNDAVAQLNLGSMYAAGEGMSQPNMKEAATWLRKAADQGLAEAQFRLGYCYERALGLKKDDAEAVKWYQKAAEQGWREAQVVMASRCYQGIGTSQDYAEAVKWYVKAAEQGNAEAQYRLGVCYSLGQGVPGRDFVESYKWLSLAATQGRKDALEMREKLPSYYKMTPEQVAEGRKRAGSFTAKPLAGS
jgi:TPR repeat protein